MLKKVETLDVTRSKDMGIERTREVNGSSRLLFHYQDEQDIDAIWNETLTTIRLLATENPIRDADRG